MVASVCSFCILGIGSGDKPNLIPNPRERVVLLKQMVESAKVFCEDEGISVPVINCGNLPKDDYGMYRPDGKLILIDMNKENDYVMTFFHELIHHWQWQCIGSWYAHPFYNGYSSQYFESAAEVEARSFAQSIVEELDQS